MLRPLLRPLMSPLLRAPLAAGIGGGLSAALDLNFAASGTLDSRVTFTRASSATRVNASGVLEVITSGNPRFTYDPVTHAALGLLIEEQRTQLLLNSLIDGTNLSTQSVTTTATAYTLSFYGTGTVTLSGTSTGAKVGTGGYPTRSTLTFTPTAGSLTLTVTGTVQYALLEAGSFATSFIPSAGASVTRAADNATMTGSNFSSWFNATQGTFVAEERPASFANTPGAVFLGPLSGSGGFLSASGFLSWWNSSTNLFTANAVAVGTLRKESVAYTTTTRAVCLNAGAVAADANAPFPSTRGSLYIGASPGGGAFTNGPIARLRYYNTALTNAQLQSLTT